MEALCKSDESSVRDKVHIWLKDFRWEALINDSFSHYIFIVTGSIIVEKTDSVDWCQKKWGNACKSSKAS